MAPTPAQRSVGFTKEEILKRYDAAVANYYRQVDRVQQQWEEQLKQASTELKILKQMEPSKPYSTDAHGHNATQQMDSNTSNTRRDQQHWKRRVGGLLA